MTNITETIKEKFVPKATLIVYKQENHCGNDMQYYLETRPVKADGSLGVARPVSRRFIQKLAKAFRSELEMRPHGAMPSNMLLADSRIGQEAYIWWTAPKRRKLFFSKDTGMEDGEYNMPGCIFFVKENSLNVYCFNGKEPKASGKLLYGPFYNYYSDNKICLGNAKVKWSDDITWKEIQSHWEKLFWASENSHTIFNPMKKDYILTVELNKSKTRPFDTSALAETKLTLKELIEKNE